MGILYSGVDVYSASLVSFSFPMKTNLGRTSCVIDAKMNGKWRKQTVIGEFVRKHLSLQETSLTLSLNTHYPLKLQIEIWP